MKVVVDIYGGDNAPNAIIDGCVLSLNSRKDFDIVMVGKVDEIKSYLATCAVDMTRIELVNADEVISCEESPTVAVRTKKNSSLVVALDITKNDDDVIGLVSAGSTGAVLTGATLKIGRIQGVARPALAPLLPTLNPTQKVLLIDCGANVDCKPNMLLQFGQMGSAYMKSVFGITSPKVGLLCNGTEEHKGNELTHEAFALLKSSRLNFVGNMEARDILSGNYDVVVADGFAGNVALKSCEGTAGLMMSLLKEKMTSSFVRKLA
ncbi:MAG: phosphate acyltransferase PlsX, partial [Clostridia bacterium]